MFLRFFLIIALSVMCSVIFGVIVGLATGIVPPPFVVQMLRDQTIADLSARSLSRDGHQATERVVALAAILSPPTTIVVAPAKDCSARPQVNEQFVQANDGCFRISSFQPVVPWRFRLFPLLPFFIGTLLVAIFPAFLLARYFQVPLELLRTGLMALSNGEFDHRIGQKIGRRGREIMVMADDFDKTGTRLQLLRNTGQRLFHDVSHELRSPLARIQAATGVLRQNPTRLGDMLPRIEQEIGKLDTLVGEIMTFARMEAWGSSTLDRQRLDIVDLITSIVQDANFEGQGRNVRCSYDGVASVVSEVNGEMIYRALENIVRNAVRHTADASEVVVRSMVGPDAVLVVSVQDQGPGVEAGELESIFLPFFRAGEPDHANAQGHGLGLAIVRRSIEAHGGSVLARPAADGGLILELRLPIRA